MKLKSTLLLFTATLSLAGCGDTPAPQQNVLESIQINSAHAKTEYSGGDTISPTGLYIIRNYTLERDEVAYEDIASECTFSPSLTTPLKESDTTVTVTYKGKSASYTITVEGQADMMTVDFTEEHEQEGTLPTTGDTNNSKFKDIINTYYISNESLAISTFSGEFAQLTSGDENEPFYVTETRSYDQVMVLGGRKKAVDITLTFETTIKKITINCEAYCKYVSYNSSYNVDYDTSLTINGVTKNIAAHKDSDENEVQHLDYTINSTLIHIEAPNTNTGASSDKKGNRILVYQMFFEY